MEDDAELPTYLDALCALERAVEKEWWWLAGALHSVAQVSADVGNRPRPPSRATSSEAQLGSQARRDRRAHRQHHGTWGSVGIGPAFAGGL
jgi:hypothetical protein